ncbi:MAG: FGGY family carbohydrate kinase, partial [Candidatus Bathyarchaeia archaeon]
MLSKDEGGCLLALDEGTTSARAIIFDKESKIVGLGQYGFPQIYPKPGWVEHNPEEIWNAQVRAIKDSVKMAGIKPCEV